ncbi:hypothetical protein J5X98_18255 [Leptothermofonsia sichuanensis E412]|uniref:hypothetical protein n=1 Tax=Leptothermofonsia sichuanensis TaxID=2917832 RepID=UPI001CA6BDA9|nr:hypothetical protein [Leptothermofonsia sichuanensis]QZZ19317.1 hypothetical protein J5X98_18255 [Leptothermofonsia sichuanensis E412]
MPVLLEEIELSKHFHFFEVTTVLLIAGISDRAVIVSPIIGINYCLVIMLGFWCAIALISLISCFGLFEKSIL